MSEQWTIENDTGAELTVRAPNGFGVELDANSADPRERFAYFAIRQQARDLDQLRTDLAAAVAERDRLTRSIEDDFSGWRAVERRWKLRAEQAESRLAAIEAAPTVAWQWMDTGHFRKNKPDGALVFDWRPLIARPAKD